MSVFLFHKNYLRTDRMRTKPTRYARSLHYPKYWIPWRAKLTTSKVPAKTNCLSFSMSFVTYNSSHTGNQNCIGMAERTIVPDCALRTTVMFSVKFEYAISNPEKPLQTWQTKNIRYQENSALGKVRHMIVTHPNMGLIRSSVPWSSLGKDRNCGGAHRMDIFTSPEAIFPFISAIE